MIVNVCVVEHGATVLMILQSCRSLRGLASSADFVSQGLLENQVWSVDVSAVQIQHTADWTQASVLLVPVFGSLLHVCLSLGEAHSLTHSWLHRMSTTVRKCEPEGSQGLTIQTEKQHPSPHLYQLSKKNLSEKPTTDPMDTRGKITSRTAYRG